VFEKAMDALGARKAPPITAENDVPAPERATAPEIHVPTHLRGPLRRRLARRRAARRRKRRGRLAFTEFKGRGLLDSPHRELVAGKAGAT
jgi:hypothetical protein